MPPAPVPGDAVDPSSSLPADVTQALRRLATTVRDGGTALVALDFDGVLAPLQDDPAASRALPAAVDALRALGPVAGLHLALVSGRAIGDLADKAEVPDGTLLVGSHGAERGQWTDGALARTPLTLDHPTGRLHAELTRALDEAVAGSTARVEHKPASVVLHTRTASPQDAARLTDLAMALGQRPGVDAMRGKDVVELAVLHVTKGQALADLRRELGVDALLYAGDDVTDERAFATLGAHDLTVKVGPGTTAARFRVADPDAMAAALTLLAAELTG